MHPRGAWHTGPAMRSTLLSLGLLACSEPPAPPEAPRAPPRMMVGKAPKQGPEDLASSWSEALAAVVPPAANGAVCSDADGDGFVDAWACPATPIDQADCNDHDAKITPANERFVRPGPFLMGSASPESGWDERPVHIVYLSGYCLEVNEHATADGRPLEGISWDIAKSTCEGLGLRLPTEAEWEKGARGGCELGSDPSRCDKDDLRAYPWGNNEAPSCANSTHQSLGPQGPTLCESGAHAVTEAKNTSPYGLRDMAGNVWEYVADRYHMQVYAHAAVRTDPLGPPTGDTHVLRGGGWNTYSTNMRVANRFLSVVEGSAVGMRCARGPLVGATDDVPPVEMVAVRGEIVSSGPKLEGVAINIAAFNVADLDPATQMPNPGRSPIVEEAFKAEGHERQAFEFHGPRGLSYQITAGLDAGAAPDAPGKGFRPQSGSGGFGRADRTIQADGDVEGVIITIVTAAPPPGPRR